MTTLIRLLTDLRTIANNPEHHHPERLAAIANDAINALTRDVQPHELGHTLPIARTITIDSLAVDTAARHLAPTLYRYEGHFANRGRRLAHEDALELLNTIHAAQSNANAKDTP